MSSIYTTYDGVYSVRKALAKVHRDDQGQGSTCFEVSDIWKVFKMYDCEGKVQKPQPPHDVKRYWFQQQLEFLHSSRIVTWEHRADLDQIRIGTGAKWHKRDGVVWVDSKQKGVG